MGESRSENAATPPAAAPVEWAKRLELARQVNPEPVERPKLRYFLAEARAVLEPARRLFRTIDIPRTDNPRTIMLLPGFATHPIRMKYMAQQLERGGHTVKRWGMGFNLGPTQENVAFLERRLIDLHERYGRAVVLIGWSLGGLFARELAKRQPDRVAKVITMGSPFSGNPRANNAWRIYQFVAGHAVDAPPIDGEVREKPPVETIAFWSRRDGIVSPSTTMGQPGETRSGGRDRLHPYRIFPFPPMHPRGRFGTVARLVTWLCIWAPSRDLMVA